MKTFGAKVLRIVPLEDGTSKVTLKCPYCFSTHYHLVDSKLDLFLRDAPCSPKKEYVFSLTNSTDSII